MRGKGKGDLLMVAGRNVMRGFVWGALVAGLTQPALMSVLAQDVQPVLGLEQGKDQRDKSAKAAGESPVQAGEGDVEASGESEEASSDDMGVGVDEDSGGDDHNESEEPDLDAPLIEAFWADAPLEEGAVYDTPASLSLVVSEQTPLLDEEGRPSFDACLTNTTSKQERSLRIWEHDDDSGTFRCVVGGEGDDQFEDGSYTLVVTCVDAAGNVATLDRGFCLDTQGPIVTLSVSESAVTWRDTAGNGYAKAPFEVGLSISDQTLDCGRSRILGVSLAELMEGTGIKALPQGVSCGEWMRSEEGGGIPTYTAKLVFDEGGYDLGELVVAEDALERTARGVVSTRDGDISSVVVDATSPEVFVEGVGEGSITRTDVGIRVHVRDENLGALAMLDPTRPLFELVRDGEVVHCQAIGYEGATPTDREHLYELEVPAPSTHEGDGDYALRACVRDLSGNVSKEVVRTFALDTASPELSVTFDDEQAHNEPHAGRYFQAPRRAHIVLRERTLCVEGLNSSKSPIRVVATAKDGRTSADIDLGAWHRQADGVFERDVVFPANGTFELVVEGSDEAGNPLVGAEGTAVSGQGRYASGGFVVDDEAPQVEVFYKTGTQEPQHIGGVDYFRRPVTLCVVVRDRNFDPTRSAVSDAEGAPAVPQWKEMARVDDATRCYVAQLTYGEQGVAQKRPLIRVRDLAGNATSLHAPTFVVDQTAPTIQRVTTNATPATVARTRPDDDPVYYYDDNDGTPVTLTFCFADEQGLARAWVDDPDGAYSVEAEHVAQKKEATLTLRLKDQEGEGAGHDTQLERDVRLHVRDLAGNVREWTLDKSGRVVTDRARTTQNLSLDDGGVFPLALVRDISAPKVSIEGVSEGTCYAAEQAARIRLDEGLFSHVLRFDPLRVIVTVERWDATPERAHSSWTVCAKQFEGEDPAFEYTQPFVADGHYAISAQLCDMSGNRSNLARVGEFTVDTSAPIVSVSWDNEDVHNGSHYNRARMARINVMEHNFDPSLVSIHTTGSVGGWSSEGDVHTCEVSFVRDASARAPHTLRIEARDLAGNEAAAVEVSPFAIDTVAPTLEILKRVSEDDPYEATGDTSELCDGSAFAQALEPVVECRDAASFDASGVDVRLVGKRGEELQPNVVLQEGGVRLEWPNVGYTEDGEGGSYSVDADDVYTLTAKVRDLAGNESEVREVTFSVNRYGSNFYVEELEGQSKTRTKESDVPLLTQAPRVMIHEVNVSGAASEGQDGLQSQVVTKEHAHVTSEIARTNAPTEDGYVFSTLNDGASDDLEGWSEYVYDIQAGNFGKGSDSDYGDGGQGLYRVDVSSRDKANNLNTTMRFWGAGRERAQEAKQECATVAFTLDEEGPRIADLVLPPPIWVGNGFEASFRIVDDITNGDNVEVLVDGERVDVFAEGTGEALGDDGEVLHQGAFTFVVEPKPLVTKREVEIRVGDYTGLPSREQVTRRSGFAVTTLVPEALCCLAAVGLVGGVGRWVAHRVLPHT